MTELTLEDASAIALRMNEFPIRLNLETNHWEKHGDPFQFTKDYLKDMSTEYPFPYGGVCILRMTFAYRFFALEEWHELRDKTYSELPEDTRDRSMRGLMGDDVFNHEHPVSYAHYRIMRNTLKMPVIDKA